MFTALVEYIIILHLAFDNQGINQSQIKRFEVSKSIESITKFILPLYNIFFPIIYFIVCLHMDQWSSKIAKSFTKFILSLYNISFLIVYICYGMLHMDQWSDKIIKIYVYV